MTALSTALSRACHRKLLSYKWPLCTCNLHQGLLVLLSRVWTRLLPVWLMPVWLLSASILNALLGVQAGLIPRIFTYLFHRIEQVQNEQVIVFCTAEFLPVTQMRTANVHGSSCRYYATQPLPGQLASINTILDAAQLTTHPLVLHTNQRYVAHS